ncbi:hypothetical protein SAY87_007503 [Trapa incisa]|uniref:Small EDRK-rich factor-like N-terminal domain-containing protein n=2 Tax=Trapa TaxID=22665 RepID=A0AAN7KVF1_TRANT|nr:hypothetical protein SAY87_007503 [Trapa incisa]KAK4777043.1 hypothetical protein SAY86_005731 [Trapa natans]
MPHPPMGGSTMQEITLSPNYSRHQKTKICDHRTCVQILHLLPLLKPGCRFSVLVQGRWIGRLGRVTVCESERGNQRERDRERAQARAGHKAKNPKDDGLTPEQRRERDAKALQEKAARKAAQAASAGGNNAGGGGKGSVRK